MDGEAAEGSQLPSLRPPRCGVPTSHQCHLCTHGDKSSQEQCWVGIQGSTVHVSLEEAPGGGWGWCQVQASKELLCPGQAGCVGSRDRVGVWGSSSTAAGAARLIIALCVALTLPTRLLHLLLPWSHRQRSHGALGLGPQPLPLPVASATAALGDPAPGC